MKPTVTNISNISNTFITLIERDELYFSQEYHFHPEFELVYIEEGTGKKIIGSSITPFGRDELVLIGPNLPHVWISDKNNDGQKERSKAAVVYFNPKIFSEYFFQMEEARPLKKLFSYAQQGISITGDTKKEALIKLKILLAANGINKIICLLDLLNTLAGEKQISCFNHTPARHQLQFSERLTHVFTYINSNLKKNITLKDAAKIANLTPQSFCRYFKQKTGKKFVDYLHETRILNAKNLLLDSDFNVAEIAYKSGYKTASNFNKLFKKNTGFSPTEFRKAGA